MTWFLITTSAKLQMNDIIASPDFSFSNLLLSNDFPYNFHFLHKFSGVSELLAELPNTVMCDLSYIRHVTLDNIYRPN